MTEIIANIKRIRTKTDKNNNNYLVIETRSSHVIFVFSREVPAETWVELKLGQEYQFTLKDSSNGDTYILTSFTKVYTFEYPPKN